MMSAPLPPAGAMRERAIVLVHGAWVGEWCWSPVESALRASGRAVHAVALRLVGHSYGGRVITQVAARAPERISSLVFLDAHAPNGPDPGIPPPWVDLAEEHGGMLPFTGYEPDPADVGGQAGLDWFLKRVAPQSMGCFREPWQTDLPPSVGKVFVYATGNQPSRFEGYAQSCREDPAWSYHEVDGPHFLMITNPAEVVEIVLDA